MVKHLQMLTAQENVFAVNCLDRYCDLFSTVGATAHAGAIVDLGCGVVELPIPDIGNMATGSAGDVLNSVAPLLGSAEAPGTVPGFPSFRSPWPHRQTIESSAVGT